MGKHREKDPPFFIAFLDLEKAFDGVLHAKHLVPEGLVRWVQLLYHDPKSKVRSVVSVLKPLRVFVGVHEGIVLSPLLFVLVMDTVTWDIQRPAPYTLLYIDDVFRPVANLSKNGMNAS